MVKVEKFSMSKNFNGRKYALDQIYWDKERAKEETAEARKNGFYAKLVPIMYEGEVKYARYVADIEYVRKKLPKKVSRK